MNTLWSIRITWALSLIALLILSVGCRKSTTLDLAAPAATIPPGWKLVDQVNCKFTLGVPANFSSEVMETLQMPVNSKGVKQAGNVLVCRGVVGNDDVVVIATCLTYPKSTSSSSPASTLAGYEDSLKKLGKFATKPVHHRYTTPLGEAVVDSVVLETQDRLYAADGYFWVGETVTYSLNVVKLGRPDELLSNQITDSLRAK